MQATIRYFSSFLCTVCSWFAQTAVYETMHGRIRAPHSTEDIPGLRAIPLYDISEHHSILNGANFL